MFEKVILRRSEGGAAITAGELAEALFYYQNVHLVLGHGSLVGLDSTIGFKTILKLLKKTNFSAVYCEDQLGTKSETKAGRRIHSFVSVTYAGSKESGELPSRKKRLRDILQRRGYKKREAKKLTERFSNEVPTKKLNSNYFTKGGLIQAALDDLEDEGFIDEAIRCVISKMLPGIPLPSDFFFRVELNRPSFHINTNLNFEELNRLYRSNKPSSEDVTEAQLIGNILTAKSELMLAAHYGGEYYTSDVCSDIIRIRNIELMRRIGLEISEKDQFQEIVLNNGRAIREVINSGERSFDEFLILLDEADKFKEWIVGINPDENFVRQYMNEMANKGWISKIPAKGLRYLLSRGAGMADPIIGTGVSACNTFLIEKIFGGWRPSHFVNRKLKPFVDPEGD